MDKTPHKHILILSDIEGSSLCPDYASTRFMGKGWPRACLGMSLDVAAVVDALFEAGVASVRVKDFHRTGYNIFPEMIHSKAKVVSGYKPGPVPGIGKVHETTGLIMLGMHAPSGSKGFLAHTLTSRLAKVEVNGRLMSEAQLFSASLGLYGLVPIFFSGCPDACRQAAGEIRDLTCFPIDKKKPMTDAKTIQWRNRLAKEAVTSLCCRQNGPYLPRGPFHAVITLKNGPARAAKISKNWGIELDNGGRLHIRTETIQDLYMDLIKLAYFSPAGFKLAPIGLFLYHLMGRAGLAWARLRMRNHIHSLD